MAGRRNGPRVREVAMSEPLDVRLQAGSTVDDPVDPQTKAHAAGITPLTHDRFIDNLAHALRSSLGSIRTWTGLLEDRQAATLTSPIVERAIAGIHAGVDQQVRLIAALCDASELLGGRLRIHRKPMLVRPAIVSAVERVRSAIDNKALMVEFAPEREDATIDGDPERIVQIFEELLCNAVRCTPAGGRIRIDTRRARDQVVVTIEDSGRGLMPGFKTWLFDPLRAIDANGVIDGRLGLGLAVTRALVVLHDGSIKARSAGPGCGTTMTVVLPLARSMP